MPVSATYQCCHSVPPISASQFHLSVPCCQCCLSVPPISAIYECCLSVPISDACHNAHQCHLPVPPRQCPSVPPISAAY
ncbi:unnamed protein product, partial [Staurois parvus]